MMRFGPKSGECLFHPTVQMKEHATDECQSHIYAFWCRIPSRPNFGDALTPWLVRRITGQHPIFVRPEDRRHKYFVTGSVLSYAGTGCSVWGAGIMYRNDFVSPEANLLAVRGPLTRTRALECGADCPPVYGDPAMLLPRFYRPGPKQRHGLGIIAHFSDRPRLPASSQHSEEIRWIDIQDPVESVIDQIASCEFVASSSLHGLIASHAYGIPAVWVKFRNLPSGDDSKFQDYFLSIGEEPPTPFWLRYDHIDCDTLARLVRPVVMQPDLAPLWQACPFRIHP
jgi:pyruvyltransferase